MVIVVEFMQTAEGKLKEAAEFLKKATGYVRKTFGAETKILRRVTPRAGEGARWIVEFTFGSLAAWGEYQEKMQKDPQWQALVEEGFRRDSKCFAHNSFSRSIYEVME